MTARHALFAFLFVACKTHSAEVTDAALPLEGFEGEIDSTGDVSFVFGTPDSGTRTELKVEIKGDKIRVERDARWVTIIDAPAKKYVRFDTTTRMYITDTLEAPANATSAKRTGSDVVAGIPCAVWEEDEALGHRTVCLAPGLRKTFMFRAEPTGRSTTGDVIFANGFPLRDVTRAANGQTMWRVETTRVVRRSVADADFVMPVGYKQQPPLELRIQ